MIPHIALAFTTTILVAAPMPFAPGTAPPGGQDVAGLSEAARVAVTLGRAIGSASECSLDGDRIGAATTKAQDLVNQAAQDGQEDDVELDDQFHDGMAEGREAVLDGTTNCSDATATLRKLEGHQAD